MLQTFVDLRGVVASVRRVRATLGQLPPDESMAAALPPPPAQPWLAPPDGQAGHAGLPDEAPAPEPRASAGANGWAAHEEAATAADGGRAVAAAHAGDLRLEGVSFAYPTRPGAPVLRDLTLTLPRGKVTAVVGRSGAGKSTVAALLERLYAPDAGAVTLGGHDIRGFGRAEWTRALAAVSQEPVLFPASIAYNIGGRARRGGGGRVGERGGAGVPVQAWAACKPAAPASPCQPAPCRSPRAPRAARRPAPGAPAQATAGRCGAARRRSRRRRARPTRTSSSRRCPRATPRWWARPAAC